MHNGLLFYTGRQTGKANLQNQLLCQLAEHGRRVVVAHPTTKPIRMIDLFLVKTESWLTDVMSPPRPRWEAIELPTV